MFPILMYSNIWNAENGSLGKNPRTLNGKAKKVGVNVNNVEVRFWVETLNLHNNKKIPFSSRNSLGSIHNPFNLLPFTTEHFSVLFY